MSTRPPIVENPLFFLDYDGTLAPIVEHPQEAHPHPEVPALLEELDARFPVWIVTGRHMRDLGMFLEQPFKVVGLHGMQEGAIGGEIEVVLSQEAEQALEAMRSSVPEVEGIRIEDKTPTFAVHYRGAPDEGAVREALTEWTADMPDVLDAIWGKKVVELRPKGTSKGVAVRRLAAGHPDRTPLYLGDDVTDEDAFEVLAGRGITIKIGEGDTVADYRLPDVNAVVEYLRGYLR